MKYLALNVVAYSDGDGLNERNSNVSARMVITKMFTTTGKAEMPIRRCLNFIGNISLVAAYSASPPLSIG
ncbi:hypothetical protein [Leptolyngbya sp. 7M]|uniref:hypothetical protein n=1 Tax=Leptolyngbya sp. 7M TaxID=2812896 RepID=UPI001B8C990D|nr:hypothetical protein [Leptolyngbya sp. 7M]QYO65854.1 hypothetical protein JVX88_03395 [Leptolyngbya sp. 7M]